MTRSFKITHQDIISDDFNQKIAAEWARRHAEVAVADKRARDAVRDAYFAERPQHSNGLRVGERGGRYYVRRRSDGTTYRQYT